MKNFKYLVVATSILTLALTGCGATEETSSAGTTTAEATSADTSSTGTVLVEPDDAGVTYKALDSEVWSMYEEDSSSPTITIHENHVVVYTDSNGDSVKGFYISDPYSEGDSYSYGDSIVLNGSRINTSDYLTNLQYFDDDYNYLENSDGATTLSYYDNGSSSPNGYGESYLVMIGESPSVSPDTVFAMFVDPSSGYDDRGSYFSYNSSTGEKGFGSWSGAFDQNAESYTDIMGVAFYESTDASETTEDINIGVFEKAYFAMPYGSAAEALVADGTEYKAGNSYDELYTLSDLKETITIADDNTATWVDSDGKTWNGYFFENLVDWYVDGQTFFEFTDGTSSVYLNYVIFVDKNLQEIMQSEAEGIIYESEIDEFEDFYEGTEAAETEADSTYGHSHLYSGDLLLIDTASSVASGKLFFIYYDTETALEYAQYYSTATESEFSGIGGYAIVYDQTTGAYEGEYWCTDKFTSAEKLTASDLSNIIVWEQNEDYVNDIYSGGDGSDFEPIVSVTINSFD